MFRGIKRVILDTKNRLKLPARYKQFFPADIEPRFVLTIDTEFPCLLLYLATDWVLIEEKVQGLPSFNPVIRRIQHLLIGHATDVELDTKGRILLPEPLRKYAHIQKEVAVVGQGKKIELWEFSEWERSRDQWILEPLKPGQLTDGLQSLAL